MIPRIDFVVNAFDSTAGVDKEAYALRVPCLDAVAGPVSQGDLMCDVAEQPEAKVIFASEGGIVGNAVETDADDLDFALVEIFTMVAQTPPLETAARSTGLGKEPQENPAAAQAG